MPIAVHGATGRTGEAVLEELRARGIECAGGGRDVPLDELVAGCSVLVNCSGPRREVAEAAVRHGLHLVDGSGGQGFVRLLLDELGPAAAARGVCLVPAAGFDHAVGDCLARLAAEGHEPLREVVVAYAVSGAGTSADAVGDAGGDGEVEYRDASWRPAPRGVRRVTFAFPEPLGRQVMQHYGSGEPLTVPRHTRTRSVVTLITASTWAPHPALAPAIPYLRPVAAAARRSPWTSRLLGAAAGSVPEDGPRPQASFTVAAVATGEDGSAGRALARGGDFDRLTAGSLAVVARRLAEQGGPAGGASPAQALPPAWLLDELGAYGLRWERG